jgi:hypothetical protein
VLESVGNNPETIYYNYNQYKYLLLPFKFVDEKGLDINTNDLCEGVEVEIDKYTNEKKTQSETIDEVSFIRYSNKGKSSQYVSIYAYGPKVVVDGKGLIILFESGKKIIRTNEKISVDVSSNLYNPYRYSVFFTPTVTKIQLLKKEVIVGAKLYIFESNVNEGEKLKKYANCVLIIPKVKK